MALFADVTLSTEALVAVGAILAGLVGAITALFRMVISGHERSLVAMQQQRDSYREIAFEAVGNVERLATRKATAAGVPIPALVAPVVPEHSSPVTVRQKETADLATLRARLVASTLLLELPPREVADADKSPPGPWDNV